MNGTLAPIIAIIICFVCAIGLVAWNAKKD